MSDPSADGHDTEGGYREGDDGAALLAVIEDAVLGAGPRFTPEGVWTRAGVSEAVSRQLWLAMGFAHVPEGEPVLTGRDLDTLGNASALLSSGAFDLAKVIRQTRVMSQAMATVAASHVETIGLGSRPGGIEELERLTEVGEVALPLLDQLLSYLYRRHLVAAIERVAFVHGAGEGGGASTAVGFADLAGFTAATAQVDEEALADLVDSFAAAAADVVAECGGRVVKLIGDEVLFTIDRPAAAAEVALRIVEAGAEIEGGLPVHAGVALGPVLAHGGDVFGSTVNRASRLTDAARAHSVLVDESLAEGLEGDMRFALKRTHLKPLKGLGPVRTFVLRRGEAPTALAK